MTERNRHRPLAATPGLERLIGRLRGRLTRQIWTHGSGSVLAVVAVWLAFAFFADWALHVPPAVRWLHLGVLFALPAFVLWRELFRPLSRRPGRDGLAILLERSEPELHELFVTSVQLQEADEPEGHPELVARVHHEAESRARDFPLTGVLDERRPRRRLLVGGGLAALAAIAALASPATSTIFFQRLFGGDVPWPQRTQLALKLPNLDDGAVLSSTDELMLVRVARGTDVAVLVEATGVVPEEVTLHFRSGQKVMLGSSGDGLFRTLLRSAQEDLEFWATGGDDRDGEPRVQVEVLEPPDVSALAVRVEPPAYSGLEPRTEYDHDVEVLAGSRLSIAVLPEPPGATGAARVLPDDELVALVPVEFVDREGATRPGLGFELTADASLRFRFELRDDTGLANPDPGLFAVHVVEDRRPEVELLAPGRTELDTVPGGLLPLRARVTDDFGLDALAWRAVTGSDETELGGAALEPRPIPPKLLGDETIEGVAFAGGATIEVASLFPAPEAGAPEAGTAPGLGEQVLLTVTAKDNRPALSSGEPDPAGTTTSSPVRVRIVSEDEYLRRLQDRLARLRVQATELEELERGKAARVRDLLAGLESDEPQLSTSTAELAAALAGSRRVLGDAQGLSRELAAVTSGVLYARLDDKAQGLFADLESRLGEVHHKRFPAEAWRDFVAATRGERRPDSGLAGQLLQILDLALTISEEDARAVVDSLDEAGRAIDLEGLHGGLLAAQEHHRAALGHLEELLGRLSEWDNFQSILTLTRDILNRQKALRDRTRETVGK